MKWHYIIIRKTKRHNNKTLHYYDIHEVYKDDEGNIENWTVEPVDCNGFEDVKSTRASLATMLKDALEYPIYEIRKGELVER